MDENNQGLQWSHIEPLCILRALARQLWMMLLAALTCAMAAWIVLTCYVTQQYTSSTTFSVTTRTSNLYYTNITAAADGPPPIPSCCRAGSCARPWSRIWACP